MANDMQPPIIGVTGATLVNLADGRRVPIRQLVGTMPEVWSVSEEGKLRKASSKTVWSSGVKALLKVSLASGRSIRATSEHRLFGPGGWLTVAQLTPGSRLALARTIPPPQAGKAWSDAQLVLLGQLVGDGSYLRGQPLRYTTASEANSDAVRTAAEAMGSTVKRYAGRGLWHQLLVSGNGNRWHPGGVGKWLKDLGIHGQRSHEKRLPVEVFELPDEQLGLLLRHLWATDGCITPRSPGRKGAHRVFFSTCSHDLAMDVAALLMRFGIIARIRRSVKGAHRPCYSVDVPGSAYQRTFLDNVKAFGPRLAAAARLRILLDASEPETNVDALPVEAFAAARVPRQAGDIPFSSSRNGIDDGAHKPADPSLVAWSRSDLFWDRVVAIEPDGEEEVFDLAVPGPASWIADGIVSHNTTP